MTYVMLVGTDTALLEGLAQSLAREGHTPIVADSIADARDLAVTRPPLVIVADRTLASSTGGDLLSIPVSAGGARVLYRASSAHPAALLPALQRSVLADLTLPLERYRLLALVQSVADRAVTTGRVQRPVSSENNPAP